MYHPGLVIVALGLAGLLLSGCAVRTQFQGCVIRCPDMTKDPDQIEAEGERAVLESRPIVAMVDQPPHIEGRTLWRTGS